jgi:hypothetical protein
MGEASSLAATSASANRVMSIRLRIPLSTMMVRGELLQNIHFECQRLTEKHDLQHLFLLFIYSEGNSFST